MKIVGFCLVAVGIVLTGCAVQPELIAPSRAVQDRYFGLTCEELRLELELVTARLDIQSNRQRANRTRDGWLNVVVPGIGAVTRDQEKAIAATKGELEAIQREHVRCAAENLPAS